MLTGRSPFARSTLTDTLAAIVDREATEGPTVVSLSGDWRVLLGASRRIPSNGCTTLPMRESRLKTHCGERRSSARQPLLRRRHRPAGYRGWSLDSPRWRRLRPGCGWTNGSSAPANPLANAQFTRITDFEGSENDAAISRDGRFVAFRSDRDGPVDTWVTQLGSGRFVNLTNGARPSGLVRNAGFVPDGSESGSPPSVAATACV